MTEASRPRLRPLKPLCSCGVPAAGTLNGTPYCRLCLRRALDAEAAEAEAHADAEGRGDATPPLAFRPRPPAGPAAR